MKRTKTRFAITCLAILLPVLASAQTAPASQPAHHLNVDWKDGLVLESDDGNYRIQFGTFMRFDGRFASNAQKAGVPNTFLMRTLRMTTQGRIAKYFTFKLQPDFISKDASIADAWGEIQFSDAVHLRVGRDKVPIGMEVLLQDSNTPFIERGPTVNLMPLRDTGVQLYGDLLGGAINYTAGIFNGQVDGSSNNSYNTDTDSHKDIVGRLAFRPFNSKHGSRLEHLTLATGGSEGRQQNGLVPTIKTSVQQTYFSYNKDVIANGMRTRLSPQLSYYVGPFGAYAEYAHTRQEMSRSTTRANIGATAWQAVGTALLTGETAGEKIHPKRPFDPEKHQWGAVQLTARYSDLSVDPEAITSGLADSSSSRDARVATGGVNWFLTTNVKAVVNFERSVFDHNASGARHTEHAALFRLQLNY